MISQKPSYLEYLLSFIILMRNIVLSVLLLAGVSAILLNRSPIILSTLPAAQINLGGFPS